MWIKLKNWFQRLWATAHHDEPEQVIPKGEASKPIPEVVEKSKYQKIWERAQKDKDQVEIPGNKDNPVILAWFKYTDYTPSKGHEWHDEIANCSAAVNCWVVEGTGEKGTNSAGASSWDHWGVRLDEPVQGCIACVEHLNEDGKKNGKRHVALFDRFSSDGVSVYLYGANQGNRTWSKKYDKREVNQYRGFRK